ncbi:MAG TPA: DUF4286 family protein [Gemmatimonadaceae bacterium]|nr:DUF4286 family protein [Gemmatimonadaceae bacterium]
MVTYEVTALVRADLVGAYESYMRRHIVDLLATGRFLRATFARASEHRYRIRYEASDRQSVDRYIAEDAPRLRADFGEHFPKGVEVSREIWETIGEWSA